MKITAIKTHKITATDTDIFAILDRHLKHVPDQSVIAIASKIVSICEGSIYKMEKNDKDTLIEGEADLYLPRGGNKYGVSLTITDNNLVATAGIDESNGNNSYILWPKDAQKSANEIRSYLRKRFGIQKVGVVITDSHTTPLRWGVTGMAISYSGFYPLINYIGSPDIFGKTLEFTQSSVRDGLAGAATLVMGEGGEQTPIALIEEVSFVRFQNHNPSQEELESLKIAIEDDLYAPLLTSVNWQKGKK